MDGQSTSWRHQFIPVTRALFVRHLLLAAFPFVPYHVFFHAVLAGKMGAPHQGASACAMLPAAEPVPHMGPGPHEYTAAHKSCVSGSWARVGMRCASTSHGPAAASVGSALASGTGWGPTRAAR